MPEYYLHQLEELRLRREFAFLAAREKLAERNYSKHEIIPNDPAKYRRGHRKKPRKADWQPPVRPAPESAGEP